MLSRKLCVGVFNLHKYRLRGLLDPSGSDCEIRFERTKISFFVLFYEISIIKLILIARKKTTSAIGQKFATVFD